MARIMAVTVNGDSIDDIVSMTVTPGVALDPVKDQLGSVHAWVNSSTAAVVQKLAYTVYGETTITQGSLLLFELGMQRAFTGREYDLDTELQHNRARWYNSAASNWLSLDPAGLYSGDLNYYRYVLNRPTISIDPNGKNLQMFAGMVLIGVTVGIVARNCAGPEKPIDPRAGEKAQCEAEKAQLIIDCDTGVEKSPLICASIRNRKCY